MRLFKYNIHPTIKAPVTAGFVGVMALMCTPVRAERIVIAACRAYCGNVSFDFNRSEDIAQTLAHMKSLCSEPLREHAGQWETYQVKTGTTYTGYRSSSGSISITGSDNYSTETVWNPGPEASVETNCMTQTIDTDEPQSRLGFIDLQG